MHGFGSRALTCAPWECSCCDYRHRSPMLAQAAESTMLPLVLPPMPLVLLMLAAPLLREQANHEARSKCSCRMGNECDAHFEGKAATGTLSLQLIAICTSSTGQRRHGQENTTVTSCSQSSLSLLNTPVSLCNSESRSIRQTASRARNIA